MEWMFRSDFHYDLPSELIAQHPPADRGGARLLSLEGPEFDPTDRLFVDLPRLLRANDLLVFNNTRVMRARLYGRKDSGGQVEILVERVLSTHEALAHVRTSKPLQPGRTVELAHGVRVRMEGREGALCRLRSLAMDWSELMAGQGHIPLPPYIQRPDDAGDETRYQTLFARHTGAVAAPTAGLHFDQSMLDRLAAMGVRHAEVTLHVGAGTFQPVRVDDLDQHQMHAEWLAVDAQVCAQVETTRQLGGRVIAVGTTSVRSLETAAAAGELRPFSGDSRLFIRPGYTFRVVDAMVTNFHLPESTLLMLVSAFVGHDAVMRAYRHAVAERYRFFSYGDAMFLTRGSSLRA